MTEILERTQYGAVWEDENGDRRFALHTCPVSDCGVVFEQERAADVRDIGQDAVPDSGHSRSDHIATHNPEDFGLTPLQTESYQQTLVADGGELLR